MTKMLQPGMTGGIFVIKITAEAPKKDLSRKFDYFGHFCGFTLSTVAQSPPILKKIALVKTFIVRTNS